MGENFIAVHEMLDPQVELVRGFADDVAERISQLGGEPIGTPAGHAEEHHLEYPINRGTTLDHLRALNDVYSTVIKGVRESQALAGELDAMTEDYLISQAQELEKFQWFMRAHLENAQGEIN